MKDKNKSRCASLIALIIAVFFSAVTAHAQVGLSASTLFVRNGQCAQFSSRCQSNLKNAGFSLVSTRNVPAYYEDDNYNVIRTKGVEKTFSKGGIRVKLTSYAGSSQPYFIKISFPNSQSRNSFLNSLSRVGFSPNSGSTYITPTGIFVEVKGNSVEIAYWS